MGETFFVSKKTQRSFLWNKKTFISIKRQRLFLCGTTLVAGIRRPLHAYLTICDKITVIIRSGLLNQVIWRSFDWMLRGDFHRKSRLSCTVRQLSVPYLPDTFPLQRCVVFTCSSLYHFDADMSSVIFGSLQSRAVRWYSEYSSPLSVFCSSPRFTKSASTYNRCRDVTPRYSATSVWRSR